MRIFNLNQRTDQEQIPSPNKNVVCTKFTLNNVKYSHVTRPTSNNINDGITNTQKNETAWPIKLIQKLTRKRSQSADLIHANVKNFLISLDIIVIRYEAKKPYNGFVQEQEKKKDFLLNHWPVYSLMWYLL